MKKVISLLVCFIMLSFCFTASALASGNRGDNPNTEQYGLSSDEPYSDGDALYAAYCQQKDAYFISHPEMKPELIEYLVDIASEPSRAPMTRAEWGVVADGMYALGLPHAAFLLNHSLQDSPVNAAFSTTGSFAGDIKPLNVYKNKLLSYLSPYHLNPSSPVDKTVNSSFAFAKSDSLDMYFALKKVNISISMHRSAPSALYSYFETSITDKYDFAEGDYNNYESFPTGQLVAKAYESQQAGIIVPYYVHITISGRYSGGTTLLYN